MPFISDEFDVMYDNLIKDISDNKLSYVEVTHITNKLYKLIPFDCDVNLVALNKLIIEKYSNDIDYKKEMEERRKKYSFLI